ncbi:Tropinone reductase-like [Vitis vinifera]|uniref:Tropinone reductase-like n=1 Tax=Vitis vinifera TaxID=29760 RepID=A0A438G1L5_VITVI|nr:Tropinone reductase-like [Vitis vinifera]
MVSQGMNALVTGGTKGIGHAIVEELGGLGATIHTFLDVSCRAQREKLMQTISSVFNGKLNIPHQQRCYYYSETNSRAHSRRVLSDHGHKL